MDDEVRRREVMSVRARCQAGCGKGCRRLLRLARNGPFLTVHELRPPAVAQDFVRGAARRTGRRTSYVAQDFSPAIPHSPTRGRDRTAVAACRTGRCPGGGVPNRGLDPTMPRPYTGGS